jgi:hypothetical protein
VNPLLAPPQPTSAETIRSRTRRRTSAAAQPLRSERPQRRRPRRGRQARGLKRALRSPGHGQILRPERLERRGAGDFDATPRAPLGRRFEHGRSRAAHGPRATWLADAAVRRRLLRPEKRIPLAAPETEQRDQSHDATWLPAARPIHLSDPSRAPTAAAGGRRQAPLVRPQGEREERRQQREPARVDDGEAAGDERNGDRNGADPRSS